MIDVRTIGYGRRFRSTNTPFTFGADTYFDRNMGRLSLIKYLSTSILMLKFRKTSQFTIWADVFPQPFVLVRS